ncbi:D-Ala-D-Ala carboxypeptidase family metallohydrolase [Sphingomonas sp. LHG3406-1]|uniref:D-Ala-D-Ala carboxypeptidase family metallohydrolase n=1 Tax=Sphingomonas sp. LHG3406-1 TaxID=2804617 RepID=UPI0026198647|nr:D-Ala-D-Ala carboxypeptidase family metallohydrolase [Sphingomonas sp. LHG3406-1]
MRILAAILAGLTLAAPSAAQYAVPPAYPAPVAPLRPAPYNAVWNPAADYVEAGQDEPGYRVWVTQAPWRAGAVAEFHRYLQASGVAYVAPTWQLLRTASDWRRCGADPFEVPPAEEWANIVNTLRYVRDHVVPKVGPVEPVSVFRNAGLNRCAGGAPESVHRSMSAIDFVPLQPLDRGSMIRRLCAEHQAEGPRYNAGLGFYAKMRFHVDSWKYRTWGRTDHGHLACPKAEPVVTLAKTTGGSPSGATLATGVTAAVQATAPATGAVVRPAGDPLAPLPETSGGR